MKSVVLVIFATFASCTSIAKPPTLEELLVKYEVPAIGAGVIKAGDFQAFVRGVRKAGTATDVQLTDKFHLGSCTKAMTTTLAAIFVERGRFKWSDTLSTVLPKLSAQMHPAYKGVTVEMLSGHRSGVPEDLISFQGGTLWQQLWDQKLDPRVGRQLTSRALLSAAPASSPGSKFAYSNGNYMILGAILEEASGKSWETLMREELFRPLDMTSCGFGAQADLSDPPNQPWPHTPSAKGAMPVRPDFSADNPPSLGPAGTVHCSMGDWAKFLALHMDGFRGRATKVLKAESFQKLHEAAGEYTYGGWIRTERKWAGGPALTHSGSNTMNYATAWIVPMQERIYLSVTNMGGEKAFAATDAVIGQLISGELGAP